MVEGSQRPIGMPKTVAVDVASFLDAVEAERAARICPAVRVCRPGLEPRDSPFVSRPERDGVAEVAIGCPVCCACVWVCVGMYVRVRPSERASGRAGGRMGGWEDGRMDGLAGWRTDGCTA